MTPGTRLGPYEILAPIGAGGMGEVYKARDIRLDRTVAIKVSKEQFSERFEREAQAVAALNHPNVCTLYDVGPNYLVMEFVEGATIRGPLPLAEALACALQICDALEAAHAKGIVHRDLKPANIKITPEGKVKVLDFGLASLGQMTASSDTGNSPTLTMSGIIIGTAGYMSPEQARGMAVDKRSDIWAFGVVLYEMLTGRQTFAGETVSDMIASVLKTDPDWTKLPAGTPPSVRRLLLRCLVRDRRQRLQDIGDARLELNEPAEAPVPVQTISRRGSRFAYALAAAAILIAAVLAFAHFRQAPPAAPPTVRFQFQVPSKSTFGGQISVSPDGRLIAFAVVEPDGPGRIWLRAVDGLESRPLAGTESAVTYFWSPDSRFLGFWSGSKLQKIEVNGGPPQVICDTALALGGAWRSDGTIIFGSNSRGLSRVSASGGAPVVVTQLDVSNQEGYHCWPVFLPDGEHLLYLAGVTTGMERNTLYLARLDANGAIQDRKRLLASRTGASYVRSSLDGNLGHLLFLRESALMAQPFDARRLELAGDAFATGEQVGSYLSRPYFSASVSGVVAYGAGGSMETQVQWFDRHGQAQGILGKERFNRDLTISHDGSRTVVSKSETYSGTDLWMTDIARGNTTRLTFGGSPHFSPVWSGDDTQIAYAGGRPQAIYRKPVSGAGQEAQMISGQPGLRPWDWSRDGKFLIYSSDDPKTRSDLWVLPLESGGKPWPLVQTESSEMQGRLSPDGRWLAYSSDESGRAEVYVQPFTGAPSTAGGKWQISTAGGQQPLWRGDGKEMYYVAQNRMLMAVEIRATSKFEAGLPKALFQTHLLPSQYSNNESCRYAVMPDGKRFLIVSAQEEPTGTPITTIVNWKKSRQ